MKKLYLVLAVLFMFSITACQRQGGEAAADGTGDTLGAGETTMEPEAPETDGTVMTPDPGTTETPGPTETTDESLGAGGEEFTSWDADGDGFLTQDEFTAGASSSTELGTVLGSGDYFTQWDTNADGLLDRNEFTIGRGSL